MEIDVTQTKDMGLNLGSFSREFPLLEESLGKGMLKTLPSQFETGFLWDKASLSCPRQPWQLSSFR